MSKSRKPYPPEFRQQLVDLVHAGGTPHELSREFEPAAQSITNWVAQAERDCGKRKDGLTTAEREGLTKLRRENRQLKIEREILSKAAAWFAQENVPNRSGLRVHKRESGHLSGPGHRPTVGRLRQRVLCLGEAAAVGAGPGDKAR